MGFLPLRVLAAGLALALAAGCASDRNYREGERLLAEGRSGEAVPMLEQAVREAPGNARYRAALVRGREARMQRLLDSAEADQRAGRLAEAEDGYREALRLEPGQTRATAALAALDAGRRNKTLLQAAEAAFKQGDYDLARAKLRAVLATEPGHAEAAQLLQTVEDKAGKPQGIEPPQLAAALRRPITLEFRDAPLKSVFDAMSRQGGINFVFDRDVKLDQKATLYARDTALVDVLDMLLATSQLARKVLNANTLLVYPRQPAKQKDYEDMVVKGFFLVDAEAKQVMSMIKTMAKVRDVYVDEKLNLVMVRESPEVVRLVEKLVRLADRPEPEVMLEVEILEVKRSKLTELGAQWPTQLTLLSLRDIDTVTTSSGTTVATTTTQAQQQLTLDLLKNVNDSKIAVSPNPSVNLRAEDSDVNILANPRIRVKNKEKAKIHIGDKVPVITANVTSTGVTSESVSYLDVGLKLDVEPQVNLDGDVAIRVGLEVSNIVREVKSGTGTLTYQLGSRNANTMLRLADGETQVLAGLISDEDRAGASKVPGLGDLPLLGRLFSSHRDEANKTEIVLLITPRVLRNIQRPELAESEFFAGTESNASDQPLRLRPSQGLLRPAMEAREAEPAPAPEPGPGEPAPAPAH